MSEINWGKIKNWLLLDDLINRICERDAKISIAKSYLKIEYNEQVDLKATEFVGIFCTEFLLGPLIRK